MDAFHKARTHLHHVYINLVKDTQFSRVTLDMAAGIH
jgi:hypothetical protein